MPRWFLFTLVAVFSWGLWAVLSRAIGDALSAFQSQALSTLGLIPVMIALGFGRKPVDRGNRRRGNFNAFLAGALTCAGNVAYYHALNSGAKATVVVPLTALFPLVTVLLAVKFLNERLNSIQVCGALLSLVAIGVFNITSVAGIVNQWLFYTLLPIGLWGISGLFQKMSTNDISGERSAFWFLASFVPVSVLLLLLHPVTSSISPRIWWLVALIGLTFSFGNYAILLAFERNGKASIIAPISGLYPIVSIPIAMVCFEEHLTLRETLGIVLALVSVVALAWEHSAKTTPGTDLKPQL